jgi:hypothetical protein
MTTAAIHTNEHTAQPPRTIAEECAEILAALDPPKLTDMRRRCAEALKAMGAPDKYIAAVLAVPLVGPVKRGAE